MAPKASISALSFTSYASSSDPYVRSSFRLKILESFFPAISISVSFSSSATTPIPFLMRFLSLSSLARCSGVISASRSSSVLLCWAAACTISIWSSSIFARFFSERSFLSSAFFRFSFRFCLSLFGMDSISFSATSLSSLGSFLFSSASNFCPLSLDFFFFLVFLVGISFFFESDPSITSISISDSGSESYGSSVAAASSTSASSISSIPSNRGLLNHLATLTDSFSFGASYFTTNGFSSFAFSSSEVSISSLPSSSSSSSDETGPPDSTLMYSLEFPS
mmetsp:Transcript_35527/g.46887  ORF Transcript_35527/g.46887 Transcript_35527/m.46887 type:complete len:279 (+) Transcript_35527:690-1526(+)